MIWRGGSLGAFDSREEFKTFFAGQGAGAFDDMHLKIHQAITSGDEVVLRFTNSGTNNGEFLGNPATGKHAAWLGIGIYTVRDGRIVEGWFAEDILHMLLQLGSFPIPA